MRFRNSKELKIIEQVAKSNGVSVAEVKREIAYAISLSMANSQLGEITESDIKKPITPEHMIRLLTRKVKCKIKGGALI